MIRAAAFAAVLSFLTGAVTAQIVLDIPQSRRAAAELIDAGQPSAALEITDALLRRDPDDFLALVLKTHAHRLREEWPQARQAGRHAWRIADRPIERYGAALAMAQALSSQGRRTQAQFWLRRAVQAAPTDGHRARAMRDFRYLRVVNPWDINLRGGFIPSDNVNGAPRDNTFRLGELIFVDPSAVPLSGVELNFGVTARRNFDIQTTRQSFVAFSWDETAVILSDDARDAVPGVRGSDFAFRRIGVELGRDFKRGPEAPRQTVAFELARNWFGGRHLSDDFALTYSETYLRGERGFSWQGGLTWSDRKDASIRSALIAGLALGWSHPTAAGGRILTDVALTRTQSDSNAVRHTRARGSLRWQLAEPVMGADVELGAGLEYRLYDREGLYIPAAREDLGLSLTASFFFRDFDYLGFAPKVTLNANRYHSNVTRFDTESLGIGIGFQSSF